MSANRVMSRFTWIEEGESEYARHEGPTYNNSYAQYIGDYNYWVYLNRLRDVIVSEEFRRLTDWAISTYSVLLARFERDHRFSLTNNEKPLLYNQQPMVYDIEALPYTIDMIQECRKWERSLRDPIFVTVMGVAENYDYAPARRYHAADLVLAVLEPLLDRVEGILQREQVGRQQGDGHAEVKESQEQENARPKNEQRDGPDEDHESKKNSHRDEYIVRVEHKDSASTRIDQTGGEGVAKKTCYEQDIETGENEGSVRPRSDKDADNDGEGLGGEGEGNGSSESDEDDDTDTDTDTDSDPDTDDDIYPLGRCTTM